MSGFILSRLPIWLVGAALGLLSQAAWIQMANAKGWDLNRSEILLRLGLGPLGGALVLWLLGEALLRGARTLGLDPWPRMQRLGRFLVATAWELSGLGRPSGRRAWLKGLALTLAMGLGLAWWFGWRPAQGAEAVRAYFLDHQDPAGRGLGACLHPQVDGVGPGQDLGQTQAWDFPDLASLPGGRQRYFLLVWTGLIKVDQAGSHGIGGLVDDGLEVIIDGRVVARDMTESPPREIWGKLRLDPGWHAIELRYLQLAGGATLKLWWQPPKRDRVPLGQAELRPLKPGTSLAPVIRLRLAHGLQPRQGSTYDPFEGGRFWSLPW
ncbi:MAG: hypothetical protein LDL11_04125 [Desulfarculus sp.]|nr:hypothetical protein [Desulfarculus sp.]